MLEERGRLDLPDDSLLEIQLLDLPFLNSLERAKEAHPLLSSEVNHTIVALPELADDLKMLKLETGGEVLFFVTDLHLDVLPE